MELYKITKIISIIAFCLVFAISGYKLYSIYAEYHKANTQYDRIAEKYTRKTEDPSQEEGKTDDQNAETEKSVLDMTAPIQIDFKKITKSNPDVIGWIYSEGTKINYPIVQGKDNEQYLHRLFDGSYNKAGSIFMDFRCDPTFSMANTLIYGHHMKNDSMFGSLHDYTKQKYYDKHPIIWILTPEQNYKLVLFAGYTSDGMDDVYDSGMEPESLVKFIEAAMKQSTFKAKEEYLATEEVDKCSHIVTLSTCSYEKEDGRYLVCGYLIEE